jgi:hypothetical protein
MSDIPQVKKKRGRPKGWKADPNKPIAPRKIKEKSKKVKEKLTLYITGKEKDAFDFKPLVESAYRREHDYVSYQAIVKKITNPIYWKNVEWIKETLLEFFNMEIREKETKVKRKYTKKIKETV